MSRFSHKPASYLLLLALALAFYACQEVYVNDHYDANELIPCIDGRMTNTLDYQFVNLYYARAYDNSSFKDITGAIVKVTDESGTEYEFAEQYPGFYRTQRGDFIGKPGQKYILTVELSDGTIIKSHPQRMPDTIGIEKVEYPYEEQEVVSVDLSGESVTQMQFGYAYKITPFQDDDEVQYYRLKSDFYVHSMYYDVYNRKAEYPISEGNDTIIKADVTQTNTVNCYEFFTDNQLPIIGKYDPKTPFSSDERKTQTQFLFEDFSYYTEHDFIEWIVMADVYAISQEAYDYYKAVNDQLSAPNRIYDPIPNQLEGNLYCENNPDQKVLGFFEVSAKSRRCNSLYKYVSFGAVSIESRFYPDTSIYYSGCETTDSRVDTMITEIIVEE